MTTPEITALRWTTRDGRHEVTIKLEVALSLAERLERENERLRTLNAHLDAVAVHAQARGTAHLLARRSLAGEVDELLRVLSGESRPGSTWSVSIRVAIAMVRLALEVPR